MTTVSSRELYRNYKPSILKTTVLNSWGNRLQQRYNEEMAIEAYVRSNHPYVRTTFRLRRPFVPADVFPMGEEGSSQLGATQATMMRALKDSGLEPPSNLTSADLRTWLSNTLMELAPLVVAQTNQPFTPSIGNWLSLEKEDQKTVVAQWVGLGGLSSVPTFGIPAAAADQGQRARVRRGRGGQRRGGGVQLPRIGTRRRPQTPARAGAGAGAAEGAGVGTGAAAGAGAGAAPNEMATPYLEAVINNNVPFTLSPAMREILQRELASGNSASGNSHRTLFPSN